MQGHKIPNPFGAIADHDLLECATPATSTADKDLGEGMSISPDGRYTLYSQIDDSNADIMLVNNFR
jgi:hypothetical protein